jgi:hypothetical protein
LKEINYGIRSIKVKKNIQTWRKIHTMVSKILKEKFNISDIQILYELINLRECRNNMSHTNEKITKDELQLITQYYEQMWLLIQ